MSRRREAVSRTPIAQRLDAAIAREGEAQLAIDAALVVNSLHQLEERAEKAARCVSGFAALESLDDAIAEHNAELVLLARRSLRGIAAERVQQVDKELKRLTMRLPELRRVAGQRQCS
jgi:hypothetical protein